MDFKVHQKLREAIKNEQRDIALITAPGMGLTTLLGNLEKADRLLVAWLDPETLKRYWDIEYRERPRNRRLVVHAATINALVHARLLTADITEEQLFRTNLPKCLKSYGFDEKLSVFVVIDDFDKLPHDLALIVCQELKALADMRGRDQYKCLSGMRFIIGGAIDFLGIFAGESPSAASPGTSFFKCRPHEFLLSPEEDILLFEATFPQLSTSPRITQLVVDWSGGYLHYVLEFARWILKEKSLESSTIQALAARLKNVIEEQDRIPLFSYCYSAWDSIQTSQPLVDLLTVAVSAGQVQDSSNKGRKLAGLGLLLEKRANPSVFYPANTLVELFMRQRLAERGVVLPMEDSVVWTMPSLNGRAYKLILELENRLRNFVGDQLFAKYHSEWMNNLSDVMCDEQSVFDRACKRLEQDQRSIYATAGVADPLLAFLDFSDLGAIIKQKQDVFPASYTRLPDLLDELNYYRRRIAHNRPITLDQIEILESRCLIIQRMITRREGISHPILRTSKTEDGLAVDTVFNGRYRISGCIGAGGMGAVYEAWDINLKKRCAIKENLNFSETAQRQFEREARILADLHHAHIPQVFDHFVIEGKGQYLVMSFVEGENLEEHVARSGSLQEANVLHWAGEILDALTYLHKHSVIHRDIKPANIIITTEGEAMLVDFGIAKECNTEAAKTTTAARKMTPGYASPEQCSGGRTTARSDIYSLGATLYSLLTGKAPTDALSRMNAPESLVPLSRHAVKVSRSVALAIDQSLEMDPELRFASAEEMKAALMAT